MPELTLVVPVYNEDATIAGSLTAWLEVLEASGLSAECVVVNDGSRDGTAAALAAVEAAVPARVRVIHQANAGHGAAVLAGYRAARGTWVLQVDGDDEIGPGFFRPLWASRSTAGMVLGRRAAVDRAPVRRLISRVAAAYVRWVAGTPAHDANVPYRLLPRVLLDEFLAVVPTALVAPNVALTIFAGRRGWDVREVDVVERPRVTTRRPLGGWRLWRTALRALVESRRFRA